MGILYSWATKEYLFENMTFGQIIMYLNYGLEIKYPQPPEDKKRIKPTKEMTAEEFREERDRLRRQYGLIEDSDA